jgi:hypothetical protein
VLVEVAPVSRGISHEELEVVREYVERVTAQMDQSATRNVT